MNMMRMLVVAGIFASAGAVVDVPSRRSIQASQERLRSVAGPQPPPTPSNFRIAQTEESATEVIRISGQPPVAVISGTYQRIRIGSWTPSTSVCADIAEKEVCVPVKKFVDIIECDRERPR